MQVQDMAENIGSALLHRGQSQSGDKYVGIFAQNRPEVRSDWVGVTPRPASSLSSAGVILCQLILFSYSV